MRKIFTTMIMVVVLCLGSTIESMACTTILVGKNASADGCAYAGRTNDYIKMASAKLKIFPASKKTGTYTYVAPDNGLKVKLPRAHCRCIIEPIYDKYPDLWWESGFNDAGVGISATETIRINKKVLDIDPFTKIGLTEANIPRLVLPYISSAKDGVLYLGKMIEKYGMTSDEAVCFIDNNDIWYMEALSGHRWVAHRLPDDEYACIGNDCLLDYYDSSDSKNWLGSKDVVELAKQAGTYQELDGKFHLALSYTEGKRDYSQLRVWASRRYFNDASPNSYDVNKTFSFSTKPNKKISLQDIFALTRDRNENTAYATDVVGTTRPIAIDRTAQVHFFQYKKGRVPVMWSCLSAPEFGVYLPVYNNVSSIPEGLSVSTADFNEKSFSWQLRLISDMAVTDRAKYSELVRTPFKKLEDKLITRVQKNPKPSAKAATKALKTVNKEAWNCMNTVKAKLITEVSKNTVDATRTLGRD